MEEFALQCRMKYCISANSFRGNYSFLEVGVRQVFKEEIIQGRKLFIIRRF